MSRRSALLVLLFSCALALTWMLVADPAFAQATGSAGSFSCSGGHALGKLYDPGLSCPKTLTSHNLFSFIICNMEQLSSNLMGQMFCGMITGLAPAVSAMILLAVVVFGISFTIGLTPATAREFQLFLIKVCFVWAFATQSDYLIGIGYAFFINGIRDGVAISLTNAQAALAHWGSTGAITTTGASGSAVYASLDTVIATLIDYATNAIAGKNNTTDPNAGCKNALFAVMAMMAIAFPPIFYFGIVLIGRLVMAFLRALFGYLYALIGIAFLMTLAPFFLSFFLFRQTRPMFDKWIGYLSSFALQIVLLFAFLSFVLSINVTSMTNSFSALVIKSSNTYETGSFRLPWDYCTICDFQPVDANNNPLTTTDANGNPLPFNFTNGEHFACIKYNAQGKVDANGSPRPIEWDTSIAPASGSVAKNAAATTSSASAQAKREQNNALFKYMTTSLLSLVVIAFLIESLLGYSSQLAQSLAVSMGGSAAPQLGGGSPFGNRPTLSLPFESNINDFSDGFKRGFEERGRDGHRDNSLGATTRAFKYGTTNMLTGRDYGADAPSDSKSNFYHGGEARGTEGSGLRNRLLDWFINPSKLDGD